MAAFLLPVLDQRWKMSELIFATAMIAHRTAVVDPEARNPASN
jgi:hypothetical protein